MVKLEFFVVNISMKLALSNSIFQRKELNNIGIAKLDFLNAFELVCCCPVRNLFSSLLSNSILYLEELDDPGVVQRIHFTVFKLVYLRHFGHSPPRVSTPSLLPFQSSISSSPRIKFTCCSRLNAPITRRDPSQY